MALFHFNDPDSFENHRLCKKCGGRCCKYSPCTLHESDIPDKTPSNIAKTVVDNNLSINALLDPNLYRKFDYFDFPFYFVSSATKISPRIDLLDMAGECANLTFKGCAFDSKKRPMGGRLLIPNKNFECRYEEPNAVKKIIYSWLLYQEYLKEAVEIITEGRIDEMKANLYAALVDSSDDFMGEDCINGKGYRLSYLYCLLVNEYGLKLDPDTMYSINLLVSKYPHYKDKILDFVRENPEKINYTELGEIIFQK